MTNKGAVAARTITVRRQTFTREFELKAIRSVQAGPHPARVTPGDRIMKNPISSGDTELAVSKSRFCSTRPYLR
jgi:hypothetical protein